MALGFPNRSRNYDADHHRVRFWGHDSAIEVAFVLEGDALLRLDPRTGNGEHAMLATFDAAINRIHAAASKAYRFRKGSFHLLTVSDFE